MIFSTPSFPMMHGTPIATSENPYSPFRHVETPITRFLPFNTASAMIAITAAGANTVLPLSLMTSAPDVFVMFTIFRIWSSPRRVVTGIHDTEAKCTRGIMVSPCSPITRARMSSRETPSSMAMYDLNLRVSRIFPSRKPDFFQNPIPDTVRTSSRPPDSSP